MQGLGAPARCIADDRLLGYLPRCFRSPSFDLLTRLRDRSRGHYQTLSPAASGPGAWGEEGKWVGGTMLLPMCVVFSCVGESLFGGVRVRD